MPLPAWREAVVSAGAYMGLIATMPDIIERGEARVFYLVPTLQYPTTHSMLRVNQQVANCSGNTS